MNYNTIKTLAILVFLSSNALAQAAPDLLGGLTEMAAALALLLFTIMGLRWIVADSAQEREESKKGMIYIVTGLLIVVSADLIVERLYSSRI